MRIDVVTIFPGYLDALDLSLVGKARRDGLLDLRVHDLRDWTTDRHRTVDDTPFGGGAGMVMRPDVWGRALDDVLGRTRDGAPAGRQVLLVPTPSGERLTQRAVEDLATADQLVLACGRYEGIDARVAEHYADAGVEVREFSLGDYVLNGGEVAALVVVEAVARLLPGVVGNPESLVEESHGAAGLLEYPVYTKPPAWAGREVPEILLSGHHGNIARWRRDLALERTAERRPDMVATLDPAHLDRQDRAVLARHGWFVPADGGAPVRVDVRPGRPADAAALADLAAATFPLACPPHMSEEDIAAFVAAHLGPEHFAAYLADEQRYRVLVADGPAGPVGYTLLVLPLTAQEPPYADDVAALVAARPAAELSKCYVLPAYQGSRVASALLDATTAQAAAHLVEDAPVATVWLGTNRANRRAQRRYARHGFVTLGTRRFRVGESLEEDVVMAVTLADVPQTTPPHLPAR